MTRDEKIIAFFNEHITCIRWCDADVCACMGCINGSQTHAWSVQHPEEASITKEEFLRLKEKVEVPARENISFSFKSFKP